MMSKGYYMPYYVPSPWPVMSSMQALNFFYSVSSMIKTGSATLALISGIVMLVSSLMWWKSCSLELNRAGMDSISMQDSLKFSMVLFISSEVLFFLSFFWGYFHYYVSPCEDALGSFPPYMLFFFDLSLFPLVNTFVLLSSGVPITFSHSFYMSRSISTSLLFLLITILLGLSFSYLQYLEYCNSFFSMADSCFGSVFFLLTGFHGTHVLIGTVFLVYSFYTTNLYMLSEDTSVSFQLSAWYWHFVDVVWLFLFYMIYYMNAS